MGKARCQRGLQCTLGFMFRTEDLPLTAVYLAGGGGGGTARPVSGSHSIVLSFSTWKSTDLSSPLA